MRVARLKHKLGTRAVPTAELELEGARGVLVGRRGRGVPMIASLFNVTRIHNAVSSASMARRAVNLALAYARVRSAFGKPLSSLPLHVRTLARMQVDSRAMSAMVFDVVAMLGASEAATDAAARDEAAMNLRLATPLAKAFTGKLGIAVVSEALEALGGTGYMEDVPVAALYRDSQGEEEASRG